GIGCTIEEVKKYCTVSTNPSSFSTLTLYPNPSNSYVKIEGLGHKTYTYQLSCIDGRHIHNGTVPEDHLIDIQTLDQGVYILNVASTDQTYKATRKIIKIE
ncbi:MAG TPA: T9SS type A sorting domain-containing protein, partial [Saprospiraceae bacterium]|nr:T9SS type A sorting domain-containing protein [Saprospiraceae bacterium]